VQGTGLRVNALPPHPWSRERGADLAHATHERKSTTFLAKISLALGVQSKDLWEYAAARGRACDSHHRVARPLHMPPAPLLKFPHVLLPASHRFTFPCFLASASKPTTTGETEFAYTTGNTAYTLKWTFHNELGLVFVAVYQRMLQLAYVDNLLEAVKGAFAKRFKVGWGPGRGRYRGRKRLRERERERGERTEQRGKADRAIAT